jgi:hypothetical protein
MKFSRSYPSNYPPRKQRIDLPERTIEGVALPSEKPSVAGRKLLRPFSEANQVQGDPS